MIARIFTALVIAACWPVWILAGWLEERLALDDFDILGRVAVVFLFLSVAEIALSRYHDN